MKKYYSLEAAGKEADLYIFGDITSMTWDEKDKDAYGIVKELKKLEVDTIHVHINSYGGEVAEGLAIHNVLKNNKAQVITYCDGFACSAASVIFMAGDERHMNKASLLMIHNAWSRASGDANDFRKRADDLDKITQASINAYMDRISITEEELKQLMDDETWLTADEALADGFATKILGAEERGVSQSAFNVIRNRILKPTVVPLEGTLEKKSILDADEIAEKVAKRIKTIFEQKNKDQKNSIGLDAFFNSGKGEKRK